MREQALLLLRLVVVVVVLLLLLLVLGVRREEADEAEGAGAGPRLANDGGDLDAPGFQGRCRPHACPAASALPRRHSCRAAALCCVLGRETGG